MWLVHFDDPVGHEQGYRRPAVVLSADRFNASRAGLVVVVPLTRTRRGLPSHIEVEPGDSGLAETSYAKAEDLKSISVDRLQRRLGVVGAEPLAHLGQVVSWLLGLA